MGNFYCLDNDIILKLATCYLFDNTIQTFNISTSEVIILDSFKYKFSREIKRKRGNIIANYNIEQALAVTRYCASISELNIDVAIYNKLLDFSRTSNDKNNKIDKGEAILISYVAYQNQHDNSSYLLTGDKRCLKALYNSNLTEVTQCLEHKIWSLEQLILRNIEKFGFDFVKNNVFPVRDCDIVLKAVFGSGELSTSENSIHTLRGYINVLRHETGNLLHPYPD